MRSMKSIASRIGILILAAAAGCEVNRAIPETDTTPERIATTDPVSIPGPYSIAPDGSVVYTSVPRPNGHLLGTRTGKQLTQAELTSWIEENARKLGGSSVYVRSIIGPYVIDSKYAANADNPRVYDIVIEIWDRKSDQHDHS